MFKKNSKFKILTPNGFEDFDGIKKSYKETIKFIFSNGNKIRITNNHLFENIRADTLNIGDLVNTKYGKLKIINIIKDNKFIDVYDPINIENNMYYGNNIINHNCTFLGSVNTVIESDILKQLLRIKKDPILIDLENCFRIYEKPKDRCTYCLGVDVSKGTGEHYSTIQILRIDSINPVKVEQVAVYESNTIDPYYFARVINRISIYYNNAFIIVENNSEGWAVVSELHWGYENEGLINSGSKSNNLGVRATKKTKNDAVILMKKFIENNNLILNDMPTIKQLTDFTEKANGSFSCDHMDDDLISGLYWAVYFFKLDVLEEFIVFDDRENENDDIWGILSDISDQYEEDWSWI